MPCSGLTEATYNNNNYNDDDEEVVHLRYTIIDFMSVLRKDLLYSRRNKVSTFEYLSLEHF